MPRDPISPRARTSFRAYRPAADAGRRAEELAQARREFERINQGEVDFRDILRAHGWAPVRADNPNRNCFWTLGGGAMRKLDAQNTIPIIRKGGRWTWCLKLDQSVGGRIIDWGNHFGAWSMAGKGYWETWRLLRTFLPGAPPLADGKTHDPDRPSQQAIERSTADRRAAEADLRREIQQTHARAGRQWLKLATPAEMTDGNYLLGRGIALSTQLRYADAVRSDRQTGVVAFKHTAADGTLTGFERKRDGWNKFSSGPGGKALALFGDPESPLRRIVITETGVDALSLAQLDGTPDDALYLSTGGNARSRLDPADTAAGGHYAAEHLLALVSRHPNAVIELATDRDHGGNRQAEGWLALLAGHPGGLVRRLPAGTNDWNNELRLPNPALLDEARYRKDLRKAVPPLPPPPPARPDLLPHWQAYEAVRADLLAVLKTIARGVGAWEERAEVLERRAWSAQPMARALWSAIHEGISADRPLPAAITAALEAQLPGWHAWHSQQAAFTALEDRLLRAVAWDPARDRVDHARLARTGAREDLLAIREGLQDRALPLPAAIDAVLATGDPAREDGAPPECIAGRSALLAMRSGLAPPGKFEVTAETLQQYPLFASLSALAADLSAQPRPLPDPAAWIPPAEDRTPAEQPKPAIPPYPAAVGSPEEPPPLSDAELAAELERQHAIAESVDNSAALSADDPWPDPDAEPDPEDAILDATVAPVTAMPEAGPPDGPANGPDLRDDHERSPAMDRGIRAGEARNRQRAVSSADGRTVRPPLLAELGEGFGVDPSPDRARHHFLRQLGQWYQTNISVKYEHDINWVRIRPGAFSDEVVVEFRDGSRLRDNGVDLLLNEKGTPHKAALMIEIAAAKGVTPLRLRGGWPFKLDLATACFEHGIQVLNPELRHHMNQLRARLPEREGMYRPAIRPGPPAAPVASEAPAKAASQDAKATLHDHSPSSSGRDRSQPDFDMEM